MRQGLTLSIVSAILGCFLVGYAAGGITGAVVGLALGFASLVTPWWQQPLWSWAALYLTRNRPIELAEPVSAANDRSAAGVRYQDGVAVAAIQVLGKSFEPTFFGGSSTPETRNALDITWLFGQMKQSLGLSLESMSVITAGARHHGIGDFPKVYDTLIGTPPYAGRRETWVVLRISSIDNAEALQWRTSVGAAVVAAAQRIAAGLRSSGVRARVATAADISALDRRLGSAALDRAHRSWRSLRDAQGCLASYAYRPTDITTEVLAQAWTLRADSVIQNITLFPDRTACATITVRTPQPAIAPPRVCLQTLPGRQARAAANNLVGPAHPVRGQRRAGPTARIAIPIGPSGVLLGRSADGCRVMLPLVDPREPGRIHIDADDAITKRLLIRAAATGERVTVHSADPARWESLRMPNLEVTRRPRPAAGTTISVQDGTVTAAPRPDTVIVVGAVGPSDLDLRVSIEQTGPAMIRVRTPDYESEIEVDLFRVEKRYAPEVLAEATVANNQKRD